MDELLNLFHAVSSSNVSNVQAASSKLIELSQKPFYSLNLMQIIVKSDVNVVYRQSAAIQLKNIVEKYWQRGNYFSEHDKQIIRNELLKCSYSISGNNQCLYNLLADIIAKISRSDWNQKWPNLFDDLYAQNAWKIIYRVCQVQASRRVAQGIMLFKELANAMSGEILRKWQDFIGKFEAKFVHLCGKTNDEFVIILQNMAYQMKTMNLFIGTSYLLLSESSSGFSTIVKNLSYEICTYFLFLVKCYHNSSMTEITKGNFYKLLKSMIWLLLIYQNKLPNSFADLSKSFIEMTKSVFGLDVLRKYEKLSLLYVNLLRNFMKTTTTFLVVDKIESTGVSFGLEFLNHLKSSFFILSNDEVSQLNADPETMIGVDCQNDDAIINYDIDVAVEELLIELVKKSSQSDVRLMLQSVQRTLFSDISTLSLPEIEAFLHFIGVIIQSMNYGDDPNLTSFVAVLYCPSIVGLIMKMIINQKSISNIWKIVIIKRCVWLYSRWVVDDVNLKLISLDRITTASIWCFSIMQSTGLLVKLEVASFIEHVVDGLEKHPASFSDSQTIQDCFINPSISAITAILDTTSSDTHTRLICILIKLFSSLNMWDNIDLVKQCANSIYNLWTGLKCPSRETVILRDRLLQCISTVVRSCNPSLIQPILPTLSTFVSDTLQCFISGLNNSVSNSSVLLDNMLQLWHDIISNCLLPIPQLDTICQEITSTDQLSVEFDKNQTSLLLEIIQAHFLLQMIGAATDSSANRRSTVDSLTTSAWSLISRQPWDPVVEEDVCVARIQLFDLWLLGYRHIFGTDSPKWLLSSPPGYSQFLVERVTELFQTTNPEPDKDKYRCVTTAVLTVLARLCLFDRLILHNLLLYLAPDDNSYRRLASSLLDRWLLRIDHESSQSIQQLFVCAGIHWMPSCLEQLSPTDVTVKLESVINSCIQVCLNTPTDNIQQQREQAEALPIPAERHLRLAYLYWNPLMNYYSQIKDLLSTLIISLHNALGLDNFRKFFSSLDPTIQNQFCSIVQKPSIN